MSWPKGPIGKASRRIHPDPPPKQHTGRPPIDTSPTAEARRERGRRFYHSVVKLRKDHEPTDAELDQLALESLRQEGLR